MLDAAATIWCCVLPDDYGFYLPSDRMQRKIRPGGEKIAIRNKVRRIQITETEQFKEESMKTRSEAPKNNASRQTARPSRAGVASDGNSGQAPSREQMIAEAAYYRAEQRGFVPGHDMADWLLAEADVERALSTLH